MKELTALVAIYVVFKVAFDFLGEAKVASGAIDAETAKERYNLSRRIANAIKEIRHGKRADDHNDTTVS